MNKYKTSLSFAADDSIRHKLERLQNDYLISRSTLLQVVLHQLSSKEFDKMFAKERRAMDGKQLIGQKVFNKKKRK